MKAYKGFHRDMTCKGYQYAEGTTYEHDGNVEVCGSGFHACTNPLDVLAYYPAWDGAVYHEVECNAEIVQCDDDSKVACSSITINREIGLLGLIKAGAKMIFDRVKEIAPSVATSGEQSTAATSGDQSTAATSGHQSTAAAEGRDCIAVANGRDARAKGKVGCYLVIAEYDEQYNLIDVQCRRVDGNEIKEDTLYVLKSGKFVEA